VQLAPAARLDLAVDARVSLDDERAGVGAGVRQAGELQQLPEADRPLADGYVARLGHLPVSVSDARGGKLAGVSKRQRLPGVELVKPSRWRPRLHYELLACAVAGHELIGIDARELPADDTLVAREVDGVRWHRCLRCDSWLPVEPPAQPTRERPPAREDIELPLRGKPLRDKIVLRAIAVNRAFHFIVLGAIATIIFVFASHREDLRGAFYRIVADLQTGASDHRPADSGLLHELDRAFSLESNTLKLVGAVFLTYAVIEGVEAVGLWYARRWAEYLTFIVTASLLPLEVYELSHRVSVLKMITIVINLAVVAYLLFAKRLFGLRGGVAAEHRERERDVGWEALERSAPETVGAPVDRA
jgi:uncharacterized membrane protein (DUF2068 family)